MKKTNLLIGGILVLFFAFGSAAPTVEAASGWRWQNGWEYLANDQKQTGWVNDNGTWYYLNSSGKMLTGWQFIGGAWYYLNASGAMATGWINDNSTWYYLNASGAMATGWLNDNGTWYYLAPDGRMFADGLFFAQNSFNLFSASGAWLGENTKSDKTDLFALVNESRGWNSSQYSPAAWQNFAQKKSSAQSVLNDLAASQQTVDQAYAALTVAVKGL